MSRTPTEQIDMVMGANGRLKRAKLHSYAVLLCEQNGSEVAAIRVDCAENKEDVYTAILGNHPGWNIKGIYRLNDQDFDEL